MSSTDIIAIIAVLVTVLVQLGCFAAFFFNMNTKIAVLSEKIDNDRKSHNDVKAEVTGLKNLLIQKRWIDIND